MANEREGYWTTDSSVSGTCGHRHRTLAAALSCASQGSYSDRVVVDQDGVPWLECYDDEDDHM